MKHKKQIICAVLGASLMAFGVWLTGFDFNSRGFGATLTYTLVLWAGATGFIVGSI